MDKIVELESEEQNARGRNHFLEIDSKWLELVEQAEESTVFEILIRYNRFRLRNLNVLRKRKALLLGYINDHTFPNFHTREFLKVADVISLTTEDKEINEIDRISYIPAKDDFASIRKRFPKGYMPDLFWDLQAAHGHIHPIGLSKIPFPSVASVCHVQHGPAVKTISEMFDFVLPVGKVFSKSLSYGKAEVLNFPFGINWASFHNNFNNPRKWREREVDVSVTFSASSNPVYGNLRNQVLQKIEEFQEKHPNLNIKVECNLDNEDYRDLLSKSKISLNVVAANGPYNYRSCEVVNSGALLFQSNVQEHGLRFQNEGILEENKHFVRFNCENLEPLLLEYLKDDEKCESMASDASSHLKDNYSYEKLVSFLLEDLEQKKINRSSSFPMDEWDHFLLGSFFWQQHQQKDLQLLGGAFIGNSLSAEKNDLRFFSNCLAIFPELIASLGFDFLRNLISDRSPELAVTLDPKNLKQIGVQLLSVKMDHVAFLYNFLSLSIEFNWSPPEILLPIAEQAFKDKEWKEFSSDWLLRAGNQPPNIEAKLFTELRYRFLFLPLMRIESKSGEWIAYRDYLIKLISL